MQTNILLTPQTVESVNARVDKLLKDLGNPKPPIVLDDARRLLKLDLGYYSSENVSWYKEKIHQMKVAGKQILSSPMAICEVIKNRGLKGLLLVDRRKILLDTDIAKPKLRWNEAHEINHDILPWHDGIAHGDPETTLSPACHEQIEAEANYGAGRLLFCGDRIIEEVRSTTLSFELVNTIHQGYKNTMTTSLWRVVESSLKHAFGFISVHPQKVTGVVDADIRYFVRSPSFAATFTTAAPNFVFATICGKCYGRRGPIGSGELVVPDDRGDMHVFQFETFWNGYDALTLAHAV